VQRRARFMLQRRAFGRTPELAQDRCPVRARPHRATPTAAGLTRTITPPFSTILSVCSSPRRGRKWPEFLPAEHFCWSLIANPDDPIIRIVTVTPVVWIGTSKPDEPISRVVSLFPIVVPIRERQERVFQGPREQAEAARR